MPLKTMLAVGMAVAVLGTLPGPVAAAAPPGDCSVPASHDPWAMNEAATNYEIYARPQGALNVDVIFVDFKDTKADSTKTQNLYDELIPHTEWWLDTVSHGAVSLNVRTDHKWYRMPKNSTAYDITRSHLTFEKHRAYIEDAIEVADSNYDFSDTDMVYIVPPQGSGIEFTPAYTAFPGSGIWADGKEIRLGTTLGEEQLNSTTPNYGPHTIVHETGHLFGLPDLYGYNSAGWTESQSAVGGWDLMGWLGPGASFMAWNLLKLGWMDQGAVTCIIDRSNQQVTLAPLHSSSGQRALVIPLQKDRYLVAEVRQRTGVDAGICDDGGVLIYKVNTRTSSGFFPIEVMSDNPGDDYSLANECGPKYDAPFDIGQGEDDHYSDTIENIDIELVSTNGGDFTFDVTFGPAPVSRYTPTVGLTLRKHLVAKGWVTDDIGGECSANVVVNIERKKRKGWKVVKVKVTKATGGFKAKLPDRRGTYRATVPEWDNPNIGICLQGRSLKTKHHH